MCRYGAGMKGGEKIGAVRLRFKFHLQEDVLRALHKGVGLH